MVNLVVLTLEGDLTQGVQVRLEISEEGKSASINIKGSLPPALDMIQLYNQWKDTFLGLGRAISLEKGLKNAELLRSRLNEWLRSPDFDLIRDECLHKLQSNEEVRVLIRTNSEPLRKIPWQLWDLIENNPLAEVALSATEYERPASDNRPCDRNKIKILAILGDSTGIDVDEDRRVLENLRDYAATTFLVEPKLQQINDQLWEGSHDILYFAGHSRSEGETGRIYINENECLTIDEELKDGLEKAVRNGLQVAIFNSSDGLGLARALQRLQIPQLIVMREAVPDKVAHVYLKHFFHAFINKNEKLYIAARTARTRLRELDGEYPGASFLPAFFSVA